MTRLSDFDDFSCILELVTWRKISQKLVANFCSEAKLGNFDKSLKTLLEFINKTVLKIELLLKFRYLCSFLSFRLSKLP